MEMGTGNVNASFGISAFEKDDWEPLDQQMTWGLEGDVKQENWPISLVLGYRVSQDEADEDDVHMEIKLSEVSLGVRKILGDWPSIRPFVSGGLSSLTGEWTESDPEESESDSDRVDGFWVSGGVYTTVWGHLNLGFEARWSRARMIFFDTDTEAGALSYGLLVGYHW
jgi:opacity protein-like surface antigen